MQKGHTCKNSPQLKCLMLKIALSQIIYIKTCTKNKTTISLTKLDSWQIIKDNRNIYEANNSICFYK